MLKSLKIENFRCFPSFELSKLGRVNLLVGKNNSGKTSILEAIQLLCSRNRLEVFVDTMEGRGEYLFDEKRNKVLDIRHLFYGHEVDDGSQFSVFGTNENESKELIVSLGFPDNSQLSLFKPEDFQLIIKWNGAENEEKRIPIDPNGGLNFNNYLRRQRIFKEQSHSEILTQFVRSSSLSSDTMNELFDQIVLTPNEELVIKALQNIEPMIERIASVSFRLGNSFVLKLAGSEQRVPIGSMGDGILRILGLTLAIVNAKDGILLVDEIDTGLHFSAMSDMWKLIWETAKRLNVQVFATTHSRDCWESLAEIAEAEDSGENDILIHRIEREKSKSIIFTQNQIVIAAEENIEVR
ncbi:MAG: AAA family ATPase [Snowella sp.]|nr:AAA family ATPase [Snowella sp.]